MSSRQKVDKRKSKEDTWTKKELSKEIRADGKDSKSEKKKTPLDKPRREDGRATRGKPSSQLADPKTPLKSSHTSSKPQHSPKSSPKTSSLALKVSSSPKSSPKISHSPRRTILIVKEEQHNRTTGSVTTTISNGSPVRDRRERHETKKGKPHPLSESHIQSDEEIQEDIKEVEGTVIDPIPMEEISEEIPQEEGNIDEYLNEEFEEDYEEDFEKNSCSSRDKLSQSSTSLDIEDILQAIGQENQRLDDQSSLLTVISPSAPPPPHHHLSPRPTMSFSAMTQRVKETSQKMEARAIELSGMIERETLSINLLELQPLTEYGVYMRSFGQANTSQTGTQTGQDLIEEETQTEIISSRECWTQWPPHDMKGFGRADGEEEELVLEYDSEKLLKFLERASQVCDMILEEEEEEEELHQTKGSSTSEHQYCRLDSSFTINGNVQCINWSHTHSDMMLVGCLSEREGWYGLIEVWQLSRTVQPQHCLGDHSVPVSCCSWFPLVFAGNEDGTILVWDLREPLSLHKRHTPSSDGQVVVRVPTYTTAALGGDQSGHNQPVICVETSGMNNSEWHSQGLSFQLLSLDSSGRVSVWVVVELPEGDPAGSPTDLGLAPGGRVKLIASATIDILSGPSIDNCIATGLVISKANMNTLLIGTDTGTVVRHVRYRPRAIPKQYHLNTNTISSGVTSISLHPHFTSHFLVAYTSGHVALFRLHWPHPLISWPPRQCDHMIRDIIWHPDWSSVFVCVSGDKEVYIWDLLSMDSQPVYTIKLDNRVSYLRLITSYNQSSVLVIASTHNVSLYHLDSSHFQHDHLELFENYLSTLK